MAEEDGIQVLCLGVVEIMQEKGQEVIILEERMED
jgi:hypothetical protein